MSNEKITSENLEELFDEGCDVTGFFDFDSAVVVEAELAVRAVSDIRLVGGYLLVGAHAVLDEAHLHAEEALARLEDRKSTRLNSSHIQKSRMPSSA